MDIMVKIHYLQTNLYHDSPSCSDECLPDSLSLLPHIVRVMVKPRSVVRVLKDQ